MFYELNSQVMKFKILFFVFSSISLQMISPILLGEDGVSVHENRILIPKISVNEKVCTNGRDVCLSEGVWMKYFDEKVNFLLTGHSFTILPLGAGVFYSLNELQEGDRVYLMLQEMVVFEVVDVFVTDRYDLEIENFENEKNTLVLYTCFPLWTGEKRVVVKGTLCNVCEYEI
jgi:LPXTG-site transpeptidase (sortase) family protein